jgi:hypothetical protein
LWLPLLGKIKRNKYITGGLISICHTRIRVTTPGVAIIIAIIATFVIAIIAIIVIAIVVGRTIIGTSNKALHLAIYVCRYAIATRFDPMI